MRARGPPNRRHRRQTFLAAPRNESAKLRLTNLIAGASARVRFIRPLAGAP